MDDPACAAPFDAIGASVSAAKPSPSATRSGGPLAWKLKLPRSVPSELSERTVAR